jgi:hypothetical protein
MKKTLAFAAAFALAASPVFAEVPNACEIIKVEEINAVAGGTVERVQQQKTGNPSVCGFTDNRRAAILVISIRGCNTPRRTSCSSSARTWKRSTRAARSG